ncbi:MAG: response regulator [Pseudomonadota bacterium]
MTAKQALVVDDSKSARVVLSKMLEKHALDVQSASSAEEALDYLSRHVPDVIFMDHTMPGMDGLQAIEQIKRDPSTAMIPIVMYTSQDGEVYVGQARALGAVDVLGKDIRPTQLKNVLSRLSLIESPDSAKTPRQPEPSQSRKPQTTSSRTVKINLSDSTIQRLARETSDLVHTSASSNFRADQFDALLEEQRLNLRQDVLSANRTVLKSLSHRLQALEASFSYLKDVVENQNERERGSHSSTFIWMITVCAAIVLTWVLVSAFQSPPRVHQAASSDSILLSQLQRENDDLQRQLSESTGQFETISDVSAWLSAIEWALNLSSTFDYTEVPLDDAQLLKLRSLIDELTASGAFVEVTLNVHFGEFCLVRNDSDQLVPGDSNATFADCEGLTQGQQSSEIATINQSINFANYITSGQFHSESPIRLIVQAHGNSRPKVSYPDPEDSESVLQWNKIAKKNNRIEYQLRQLQ